MDIFTAFVLAMDANWQFNRPIPAT